MIETWSPLARRACALGLLAVAVLTLDSALLAPWREQRAAYQAEIETGRTRLLRYRAGLADLQAEIAAIARLRDEPALQAAFLGAGTDGVAAAQLQELIKVAAAAQSLQIDSLQILPVRPADGVRRPGLAVALAGSFPALIALIEDLESRQPLIRLASLEVQSQGDPAAPLSVTFTAEGLLPGTTP
jgi:hypothetical protein